MSYQTITVRVPVRAATTAEPDQEELEELRSELSDLEEEVDELERDLGKAQSRICELEAMIEKEEQVQEIQILPGTPLRILSQKDGILRVETPDGTETFVEERWISDV